MMGRQQVRPAPAVPGVPDYARALLPPFLLGLPGGGPAELLALAAVLRVVELEVEADAALGELRVEAQVERRRLVLVGEERLEVHVGRVQVVGVVAVLEVV